MSFEKDLAAGEEGERFVADVLLELRPDYTLTGIGEKAKGYDLRFARPGKSDALVEVKRDRLGHETGFVFVEKSCSGKPSGIASTQATQWVFLVERVGVFLVGVERLRDALRHVGTPVSGGDGRRARGHLLPHRTLRAISVELPPF